jgi:hypothetical protein
MSKQRDWSRRVPERRRQAEGEKSRGEMKITRHTEFVVYQRSFDIAMSVFRNANTLIAPKQQNCKKNTTKSSQCSSP